MADELREKASGPVELTAGNRLFPLQVTGVSMEGRGKGSVLQLAEYASEAQNENIGAALVLILQGDSREIVQLPPVHAWIAEMQNCDCAEAGGGHDGATAEQAPAKEQAGRSY